jgi:mannose-6-phosphate isomerase-like protein (cupin superfamily)
MAKAGEVIENPVTGERMTFLKTAFDTKGMRLEVRLQLQPNAHNASAHVHPRQVERITVLDGELHLALGGEPERTLSAGETVTIGSGVPHYWENRTGRLVEARVEYEPALNTEEFFETFFALGRAGRTDAAGVPGLLQISLSAPHFGIYLAQLPVWLQKAAFSLLGPLALLLGYRRVFPADGAQRTAQVAR